MTDFRPADATVVETIRKRRPTLAPADLALLALPGLFFAGWIVGIVSSFAMTTALAAAMLPALCVLGYVLFCRPPTDATETR